MLCPIIGSVVFARAPIEFELLLGFAATEPMETHVHRFGATGLDVVVDDSKCGTVVGFNWGFGLFVAHLYITAFRILEMLSTLLLLLGSSVSWEQKKRPLTRLRAAASLR